MSAADTLVSQVLAQAPNPQVQAAMLLGSSLEGGWGPSFGVGDPSLGGSYGPFQILLAANPGVSSTQAQDPAYAVSYMLPRYEAAVQAQSPALWQSNPELAAEQAAYAAERPAQDYFSTAGAATIGSKWGQVQDALKGADPVAASAGTVTLAGYQLPITPGAIAGDVAQATGVTGDIKKAGAYIALVLSGLGLVVAGAYKTANPGASLREIPGKVAHKAKDAAAVAAVAA